MKLQFTNGYRPRFDQISRILQLLLVKDDQKKVSRQEIIAALGIPNKQIENLTSMMTGFGLVFPRTSKLTPLGKAIIHSDPYFEKLETLWIIHYLVSSNPEWVVWHRIINIALPRQNQFEIDQVSRSYFNDLALTYSEQAITKKLPKEVGAVFAAYTRSEFSHLIIFTEEEKGNFCKSLPIDIPDKAFLLCLLFFRDTFSPGSSAVNIADVSVAENSPGRVLNLQEYQVRSILGDLHDAGLVRLEQVANLDQVRIPDSLSQEKVLGLIYGGENAQ